MPANNQYVGLDDNLLIAEMDFEDRRKRTKKSKGAKRKTRAMLEAERRGPLTFASLLEEAASSGLRSRNLFFRVF